MSAMSKRAGPGWARRTRRLPAFLRQQVQGTRRLANELLGHLGVASGRLQAGVAEQRSDDANIGAVLEQVRREAMAQDVGRDAFADPGLSRSEGQGRTY